MEQKVTLIDKSIDKPIEPNLNTEYTSEIFKLEVKNLPSNFGFGVQIFFLNINLKFISI